MTPRQSGCQKYVEGILYKPDAREKMAGSRSSRWATSFATDVLPEPCDPHSS